MSEEGFLRAILERPKDDTSPLVYADWLEEQQGPVPAARAEFLRLTVELASMARADIRRMKAIQKRLQELAATLDPDWLAVVSRLKIENCRGKRDTARSFYSFRLICDRRWEDLRVTEDRAVRFCAGCEQSVHYCDSITQAREHAERGHCVAVDLGVARRKDDLAPPLVGLVMGRLSDDFVRGEDERLKVDPVSAERERKKQEKQGRGE
jgi:uncharacterized protein (TIGR02996 family)